MVNSGERFALTVSNHEGRAQGKRRGASWFDPAKREALFLCSP
jgi:hypothetical protein